VQPHHRLSPKNIADGGSNSYRYSRKEKTVESIRIQDQQVSEEIIDATLVDSFPASDPPFWTLGRDHYEKEEVFTRSRDNDVKEEAQ
jgi:hypothetical protein